MRAARRAGFAAPNRAVLAAILAPVAPRGVPGLAAAVTGVNRTTTGGALTSEANAASPGYAVAGATLYLVYWFRDVASGGPSPCGRSANFTATIRFTVSA